MSAMTARMSISVGGAGAVLIQNAGGGDCGFYSLIDGFKLAGLPISDSVLELNRAKGMVNDGSCGKCIVLVGDFLQLPLIAGSSLGVVIDVSDIEVPAMCDGGDYNDMPELCDDDSDDELGYEVEMSALSRL